QRRRCGGPHTDQETRVSGLVVPAARDAQLLGSLVVAATPIAVVVALGRPAAVDVLAPLERVAEDVREAAAVRRTGVERRDARPTVAEVRVVLVGRQRRPEVAVGEVDPGVVERRALRARPPAPRRAAARGELPLGLGRETQAEAGEPRRRVLPRDAVDGSGG